LMLKALKYFESGLGVHCSQYPYHFLLPKTD
jgi:hypothetical protein